MNENHLLHMLANPKKIKKNTQKFDYDSNSDSDTESNNIQTNSTNQYNLNSNPLCETQNNLYKTDNPKNYYYSHELKKILENLDKIDSFILNNKFNDEFEIIQNYLIDLLFLIKSKK